jgi:hypothetical protein
MVHAMPRLARPDASDTDTVQHGLELRTVTPLPRGHHQRQRLLPLLDSQMGFGGEPASGSTQRVIGGFDLDPTSGSACSSARIRFHADTITTI